MLVLSIIQNDIPYSVFYVLCDQKVKIHFRMMDFMTKQAEMINKKL